MSIGGKALVMKTGDTFGIFVLSADRTIDSKKLKEYFKVRRIRFATKEELVTLTGLPSGAVPPFGRPVFDLNLYADNSILENEFIAFNAASLTTSIKMKVEDYIKIANPIIFSCSSQTPKTPSP
jgi:Ala-tRNA(Pro) deacylase